MRIHNGSPEMSLGEVVLFALDDHSIPFQSGVELCLVGHTTPCGETLIVLELGKEGAPDSRSVVYYGTIHRVGEELWMWYLGQGEDEEWFQRVCFARSEDGYRWEKPSLGLVEYRGSKENNLVDLNQGSNHVQACVVFHDPDDADRQRRFKMAFQSRKYRNCFAVAYSPDGVHWRETASNPRGTHLEMAGGTRFNGVYYLSGQGAYHAGPARQLVTHISYDFENWSESFCVGLRRGDPLSCDYERSRGKQVHLGAALWNRGNVILGFYGQWNGHPSNDRRLVAMDLGLAVSNDGLHYREPIPDFPIVSAAEDGWRELPYGHALVKYPALIQGQGFENVGRETLFWYAPWPEQASDGVRVARWERDRLGHFQALPSRNGRSQTSHLVSAPIDLERKPVSVFLNVGGINEYSRATVEVLDEQFAPLPGYSKADCLGPESPGLSQQVKWRTREMIVPGLGPVRVRINLEGIRREDVKLYAVYIKTVA